MAAQRMHRYPVLAVAVAYALLLPLAARAQNVPTNEQLVAQVTQLEQDIQQLKQPIQQQQTAPVPQPQVTTAPVVAATQLPVKAAFSSAPGISVAMHGWVSAMAFDQSRPFEFTNEQAALWLLPGFDGSLSGNAPTPAKSDLKSTANEIGVHWKPNPWMIDGAAYADNKLGELSGTLGQLGNVGETAAYLPAGHRLTPNRTVYANYAAISLNKQDVID